MSSVRTAFLSSGVIAALLAGDASAAVSTKNLGRVGTGVNHAHKRGSSATSHHHYLHQALADLKAAEQAIGAGNAGKAHQDVKSAITQIETAIQHHKTHNAAGAHALTGGLGAAQHHKHHGHLQQALTDARSAEHQIRNAKAAAAGKDVSAAMKQIHEALGTHHHTQLAANNKGGGKNKNGLKKHHRRK